MKAFINGVEARYVQNSLSFSDDTGKRSTGSIKFIKENGLAIKSGAKVDIFDGAGSHIFGGFAKKPKIKSYRGLSVIQVSLVDNTDIAARRIVAETYVEELDHNIVKDIHTRYLAEEGIKLGVISSGTGESSTETISETTQADFTSGVLSSVEVDAGGTLTLENISDNPPISRIVEDFEDDVFNFNFNGSWYRSSFRSYDGISGFRSDSIKHRETSMSNFDISVREGAIGKLSFFYWVSSEQNEDFFEVWVTDKDNKQTMLLKESGIKETWRYFSTTFPSGNYKITLIYDKDRSVSRGYDCAMVDKIIFEEWEGLVYPSQGYRIAPKITSLSDSIKTINIEYDGVLPDGTKVEFYYSLDDQETWELAENNTIRRSINGPVGLYIKTVLSTDNTAITPKIDEIRYVLVTTSGTVIQKAVFNYVSAETALNGLCELSGATWWITADKVLHYVAMDEFKAPWDINENHMPIRNLEVETDLADYRNRQYIRAGQDTTDLQTESMKGDGSKRTFNVGFGVAERPTIYVNEVVQTVGIRQVDSNKAFYWAKGEKEITQDESLPPLKAPDPINGIPGDVLKVQYKGLFPIIVVADDDAAINEMAEQTGDTGLFETLEENENIDSSVIALEFANSRLRKYAKINKKVTFETVKKGLQAGQLININQPDYDLNDDFLISSVEANPFNDDFVIYSITCIDGEDVGGWENFFKKLAKANQTYVIRENEVLIRLAKQAEQFGFAEEMSYTNYACQFPNTTLYPSNTFYPC